MTSKLQVPCAVSPNKKGSDNEHIFTPGIQQAVALICSTLHKETLQTLCLVCKDLYGIASTELLCRPSSVLCLADNDMRLSWRRMDKFVTWMQCRLPINSLNEFQVRQCKLAASLGGNPMTQAFLSNYATSIRRLEVLLAIGTREEFGKLKEFFRHFPNLLHLSVELVIELNEGFDEEKADTEVALSGVGPVLRGLDSIEFYVNGNPFFMNVTRYIKPERVLQLLECFGPMPNSQGIILRLKRASSEEILLLGKLCRLANLKLKAFHLESYDNHWMRSKCGTTILLDFLTIHCNTLTQLSLGHVLRPITCSGMRVTESFTKLVDLRLEMSHRLLKTIDFCTMKYALINVTHVQLTPIDFLSFKRTGALNMKMRLYNVSRVTLVPAPKAMPQGHGLMEACPPPCLVISEMVRLFPRCGRVHLVLPKKSLIYSVWSVWTTLEEVELTLAVKSLTAPCTYDFLVEEDVEDHVVQGIFAFNYVSNKGQLLTIKEMATIGNSPVWGNTTEGPSIVQLKNLKSIKVHYKEEDLATSPRVLQPHDPFSEEDEEYDDARPFCSSVVADACLRHLSKLETLIIGRSEMAPITQSVLYAMCPLKEIELGNPEKSTDHPSGIRL